MAWDRSTWHFQKSDAKTLETCFQLLISYPRHSCELSFSPTILSKFRESIKKTCLGSLTDVPRVCAFGRGNTSSGAVPCDQTVETKVFNSWRGLSIFQTRKLASCKLCSLRTVCAQSVGWLCDPIQNTFVRVIKGRTLREWNSVFGLPEASCPSLFIPCLASPAIARATCNGWAVNQRSSDAAMISTVFLLRTHRTAVLFNAIKLSL